MNKKDTMKRHIVGFLLFVSLPYVYGMESCAMQRLQSKYHLFKKSDYRAPLNEHNVFGSNSSLSIRNEVYELAALALGYKHVVLLRRDAEVKEIATQDSDIAQALQQKSLYYAKYPHSLGNKMIIYTPEKRYSALLLMAGHMLTINNRTTLSSYAQDYLLGVCLDYPQRDIRFFFQYQSFLYAYRHTGILHTPEKLKRLCEYMRNYPDQSLATYKAAHDEIQQWKKQYDTSEIIEKYIHEVAHELYKMPEISEYIDVRYDAPLSID